MRRVHCKRGKYTVYAGRPGPWGNPFVIGRDGDRPAVIEKFRLYLAAHPELVQKAQQEIPHDAVLGCWCGDNEACHCDVWIEVLTMPVLRVYRVTAPTFVAGFSVRGDNGVIHCAPILRHIVAGKTENEAVASCLARGFKVEDSVEVRVSSSHPVVQARRQGWGSKPTPRPNPRT